MRLSLSARCRPDSSGAQPGRGRKFAGEKSRVDVIDRPRRGAGEEARVQGGPADVAVGQLKPKLHRGRVARPVVRGVRVAVRGVLLKQRLADGVELGVSDSSDVAAGVTARSAETRKWNGRLNTGGGHSRCVVQDRPDHELDVAALACTDGNGLTCVSVG